jgi:lipopolysaccharide transport system ATP-binding protein
MSDSDTIIEVENISKQYRLGQVSTGTISHDLNRMWHRLRGKPDPYLKVTQANVREQKAENRNAENLKKGKFQDFRTSAFQRFSQPFRLSAFQDFSPDYVWALQDINLEIKRGEVLGIIGRNGAGKSTLLKILSRVTAPTTGEIRVDGRIASLLEVGTGFHPELTGRENIFLNGSILGMTKTEIKSKLDEIVEFSGCARYVDTPVKRYSSGMMVRLGFAIAAHLEPEILIVDEVLAVGDAEFQKKCLGKMEDVASHGRTVLFVSHNMGMINQLCTRAVVIDEGTLVFSGSTQKAIEVYYFSRSQTLDMQRFSGSLSTAFSIDELRINQHAEGDCVASPLQDVTISVRGWAYRDIEDLKFLFQIFHQGVLLCSIHDTPDYCSLAKGRFETSITIPAYTLRPGIYEIGFGGGTRHNMEWFFAKSVASLTLLEEWDECCTTENPGLINMTSEQAKGKRMAGME